MQFSALAFAVIAMFGAAVIADSTCVPVGATYDECVAACEQGTAPTICVSTRCGGCDGA